MSKSGIFLEYHGPVDLQVIESLLGKLKKTREFAALNKTAGKRVYGVVVECLENILNYSICNSLNDKSYHPPVYREEDNNIIVVAGNPVKYLDKNKLVKSLNEMLQADDTSLKSLYDDKMSRDLKQGENGAGLGLLYMALKSRKRISYDISTLTNDLIYFEIKISLNKYIMRKLIIDQTTYSPMVILDPEKRIYQISGESRPPDVREFYAHIISWLDDFSTYLIKSGNTKDPVTFNFNFEYFNSSSGRQLLDICKVLAGLRMKGFNIKINWQFEKGDADMLEAGKEMSKIIRFPFEYIEKNI